MYDLLLYAHVLFLAVAVVGIALADRAAIGWVRGKVQTIESKHLFAAHWTVTLALLGLVYSGLFLFWPMHTYLITQPLFLLKMFCVGALLVNAIAIDTLMNVATRGPFASLSTNQKTPLLISGAVSGLGWVVAATAAWFQFGWLF
jgi:hypothetical protein